MHGIDVCLFNQGLFIIDLINNLALKLINSVNRGDNELKLIRLRLKLTKKMCS